MGAKQSALDAKQPCWQRNTRSRGLNKTLPGKSVVTVMLPLYFPRTPLAALREIGNDRTFMLFFRLSRRSHGLKFVFLPPGI